MIKTLKAAATNFNRKDAALREARKVLDPFVAAELKKRNTVEDLMDLIEMLPKSYMGARFVYEKIYRIQDKKAKKAVDLFIEICDTI